MAVPSALLTGSGRPEKEDWMPRSLAIIVLQNLRYRYESVQELAFIGIKYVEKMV